MSADESGLAQLQHHFIAHLRGDPDQAMVHAVDGGHLPAATGLRIYAHAYGARLREALENDHPVLGAYLGDARWESLCSGYINAHPSRVRSLRDFGNALPDYLGDAEPFRVHPQLAELARFERLLLDSFDAADDPRAGWAQLQAIPPAHWPGLRVRVHRSVRVHRDTHGSVAIWQAIKAGQSPPAHTPGAGAGCWVLWRDDDEVGRFSSLEPVAAALLELCRQGTRFADVCEALARSHPPGEVPALALGFLQAWSAQGWISCWNVQERASDVLDN